MTLDEKLIELEKTYSVPGTQLSRVYKEIGGVQWCLEIGKMGYDKIYYYADTLEKVISKAYEDFTRE